MERRTILIASLAILAALVFAGVAQPQALIVGTDGVAGDNSQTVEPITASQENGDTSASAAVGRGDGSAVTADVQKDADGGDAVVGCIAGSAANGDNGGSVSVGNCGGGGSAGSGEIDNGTAGGGVASLGCIVAELFGDNSGGAQVGSCGAGGAGGGGDDNRDNGGNDGNGGDNGGNGDEDGSGVAGTDASGGTGDENGTGPGGGGGGGEPCGTFEQASALMGSGSLPLWALGLGAIAAFGLGTFFARGRKEVDPTG